MLAHDDDAATQTQADGFAAVDSALKSMMGPMERIALLFRLVCAQSGRKKSER